MEKVCAVISVHEGGIGLAGSQENYSPKVSWSPEGYIKSNSRACISIAIYRPADKNGQHDGSRFIGRLVVGGRGSLSCRDHCVQNVMLPLADASYLGLDASSPSYHSLFSNRTLEEKDRSEKRKGRREEG